MSPDLISDFAQVLVLQHNDGIPFAIDLQDPADTDLLIDALTALRCHVVRDFDTRLTITAPRCPQAHPSHFRA